MMAGTWSWSVTLLALTWIITSSAVTPSSNKYVDSNACVSKQTCHDCIQTPSCAWCAMPDSGLNKRCFLPHINLTASAECPDNYTINPSNNYTLIRYKELTKGNYAPAKGLEETTITAEIEQKESSSKSVDSETETGSKTSSKTSSSNSKQEAVQLHPQEINLKLRINEVQKIRIEYAQAVDYQHNMILSAIEMTDSSSNDVELTYYSSCLGDGPLVKTEKCEGLKVGNKVEFTVEVRVQSCPEKRSDWNQRFYIKPIGINESLFVNLEMICDCDCERNEPDDEVFQLPSENCNNHGDLTCGICSCHENFFGSTCECNSNNLGLTSINEMTCRKDNSSMVDCSGRGVCECNQCMCMLRENPDEIIYGEFCECDNFSCDRHNKELCSGEDHGKCVCGQCECLSGWSGNGCERSTNITTGGVESPGHIIFGTRQYHEINSTQHTDQIHDKSCSSNQSPFLMALLAGIIPLIFPLAL